MNDLFLIVVWVLTVVFFMYASLKFITTRFNIHPAWIWAMTPVNVVWFIISMILANGIFYVFEHIFKFKV